jgi:hypothetical protein
MPPPGGPGGDDGVAIAISSSGSGSSASAGVPGSRWGADSTPSGRGPLKVLPGAA